MYGFSSVGMSINVRLNRLLYSLQDSPHSVRFVSVLVFNVLTVGIPEDDAVADLAVANVETGRSVHP